MRTFIKKLLPPVLLDFLRLEREGIRLFTRRPLINFYHTDFSKRVLISYITKPFKAGINLTHTALPEALVIGEIFREMGYTVDVFDYTDQRTIDFNHYDVIFGFGEPLEKSFYFNSKKLIRIYLGSGTDVPHWNKATVSRLRDVYERKGVYLPTSGRILKDAWPIQSALVDGMIIMGNEFVASTYEQFKGKPTVIPASFFPAVQAQEIIKQKNLAEAKYHFLWFGSTGAVHKGLDLLLEAFKELPSCHLHICADLSGEKEFVATYTPELFHTPNVHVYGFVSVKSEQFRTLLKQCAWAIFPSCAEGGAVSVVTVAANGGLVPVVTEGSSIHIGDFGIRIPDLTPEAVSATVKNVIAFNEEEIQRHSQKAIEYFAEANSIETFRKKLTQGLKEILS